MLRLLLVTLIAYLLVLAYMYFNQTNLLFLPNLPTRSLSHTPAAAGLAYEDVSLSTEDGVRLHAWWVPHPQPRGTIVFFHGNAGNIGHRIETLRVFHQLRHQTLIVEYRGYGQSEGRPSEAGVYRDAAAAWAYLRDVQGLAADEVVIAGRSLGAAVALQLAVQHPPRGLIMESAFTSVPDMAAYHYPWLPARRLSRFDFNNAALIPGLRSPLLLVHSRQDEIAPFSQGQRLHELAPSPKRLLVIEGGHNDAQWRSYASYVGGLAEFLDQLSEGED